MSTGSFFLSSTPPADPDPGRRLAASLRTTGHSASGPSAVEHDAPDPMSSFDAETELVSKIQHQAQAQAQAGSRWPLVGLLVVGVVSMALAATYVIVRQPFAMPSVEAATGEAQFDSRPRGAEVLVDGEARGKTPLKLVLPVGEHKLEIKGQSATRALPLTIQRDVLRSHYIELAPASRRTGSLEISSTPPGATVRVNGEARGQTPLLIDQIDARSHNVTVSLGASTVARTVQVSAGGSASVFAL